MGARLVIEGIAELPLHDGRVPEYLLKRMKALGSLIAKFIIEEYGPDELITRLADPFWFQAFNNVIGMDWDSSGATTVVLYVLKSAFPPSEARVNEVAVLGGKGSDARMVPSEAMLVGDIVDPGELVTTSRLAARVDSTALQDGYSLYIHGVVVSSSGRVLVVQQGMNVARRIARRYHVLVEKPGVFSVDRDPHSGVASQRVSPALNLVAEESSKARQAILEIASSTPTNSLLQDLYKVNRALKRVASLEAYASTLREQLVLEELRVPGEKLKKCPFFYRPVVDVKRVEAVAEAIKQAAPRSFSELLLVQGLGPEALRAIALVADLVYGYEPSFRDPTTHFLEPYLYAYAHGGKDGVPYRVKPRNMDKTIEFFAQVLSEIRAGSAEKRAMLQRLARFASKYKSLLGESAENFDSLLRR